VCERALKKAILHRKNALFYKTSNGARVGDLFMSLIYTCQLNQARRAFDQLAAMNGALLGERKKTAMRVLDRESFPICQVGKDSRPLYSSPSLEYLLGSRTVSYNWPCHIGVSFHCDF